MKIAIITISDRCSAGEAVDASGPAIRELCEQAGWQVICQAIIPDERDQIALAIRRCADEESADVVLTTGGTGVGPRDITPEATLDAVDRIVPGIAEALRSESLKSTPFAMISRGVAGLRGKTLVINFPGSPRACRECMEIVRPILQHAVEVAGGARH